MSQRFTYCLNIIAFVIRVWVRVMVTSATFNNISVKSWQSVLLVEETRVPGENHRPAASHEQISSHNVELSTCWIKYTSPWSGFKLTMYMYTLVMIQGGGHLARTPPLPPKIGKNMIFLHKIMIFHTKYPNFFLIKPPP